MRKKLILGCIVLATIFGLASLAISETSKEKKNKDELYRQVELFSDSLAIIQTDYVDETKPKDLIYGSLKGMLSSLDPHSVFMDPETYNSELKVETEGKFGGIGIELTIKDGLLTIITPIEDTPAWKAGLKSGDRILKIDNDLTRDITLTDAVKKMRGKPGEPVHLIILRESEKKLLDFKILRDIIKIKDIKEARILEDGIGYIRLVQFSENTGQEINIALDKLTREKMSALILDLRNNRGGVLDSAVDVSAKFIENGKVIVSIKGRKVPKEAEFISRGKNPILDLPMAVLVNEGSASASEIVAGCLQDYKRAIIIGTKSFGKGSVQTVFPLSDGSVLKLTTGKFFTPLGKVIHDKGVEPDIVVEQEKIVTKEANKDEQNFEEIFDELEKKDKETKKEPAKEEKQFDYKSDNQLTRAVDILKAVKLYKLNTANEKTKDK